MESTQSLDPDTAVLSQHYGPTTLESYLPIAAGTNRGSAGHPPVPTGAGERERAFGESLMARRLGNVGISGVEDCKSGEEQGGWVHHLVRNQEGGIYSC